MPGGRSLSQGHGNAHNLPLNSYQTEPHGPDKLQSRYLSTPSIALLGSRIAIFSTLFLFNVHDRAVHVGATIRADHMGRDGRAALRAIGQLPRFYRIMRATFAGSGIRMFAFRNGHRAPQHRERREYPPDPLVEND